MLRAQHNNLTKYYKIAGGIVFLVLLFFTPLRNWITGGLALTSEYLFPERIPREESREIFALKAQLISKDAEIERLNSLLGGFENKSNVIPAKIILGGGFIFADILLTDKGSTSGVLEGDVFVYENYLVLGKISEIGPRWSKVVPFSHLGQSTVLRAGIMKEVAFEAYGIGGGEIRSELPVAVKFEVGDPVWWGEDPDYLLGLVEKIKSPQGSQLQEITFKVPILLKSIYEASIIKNEVR